MNDYEVSSLGDDSGDRFNQRDFDRAMMVHDQNEQLRAADVMQTAVKTVVSSLTLPQLEERLLAHKVSGFLVVDEGKLTGVVSRSDVVRQLCAERDVAQRTSDFYFDDSGFHEAPLESFAAIADRIGERIESLRVADVMVRRLWTVSPDEPISQVAKRLIDHGVHRLPVVDAGTLIGIITTSDLVRLIAEKRLVART